MSVLFVARRSALLILVALAVACSDSAQPVQEGSRCETVAAAALQTCVVEVTSRSGSCYAETGQPCATGDAEVQDAIDGLAASVASGCTDDAEVRDAGYGPLFTRATLVDRLASACQSETRALAARSFGGPQGAALAAADDTARSCLEAAYDWGAAVLQEGLKIRNGCIAAARNGASCDPAATDGDVDVVTSTATQRIRSQCPATLASLVALDEVQFVAKAALQTECLTAIAHPDTAPLHVACGPRDDVPPVPRGQWTQVILDESVFGTRCGDGSPYAFQVWLAPEGQDVQNVVVGMQGGGVCVFEEDCASRPADLFEALSDPPDNEGTLSTDPSFNPFGNWTKVFLPYCTQDVFIGGGATSNFPSITVERFGGVDVRAALQYVRDLIWRELDRETPQGYDADRMRVLFGGFSAGAFGTLYNYHYVLDDLQWAHTAAYPDAALALDNGEALGVRGLGAIAGSSTPPLGWGAMSFLPPYCFATDCGVGPVILNATAPRLKAVPEQQFMILSNQVDETQVDTTYFADIPDWVNELRSAYCATRDLNGVHYYMPAVPESVHVISSRPELYADYPVDGVIMRDWLADAFTDPAAVQNQVVEGTLVEAFPGVNPFPCPVPP